MHLAVQADRVRQAARRAALALEDGQLGRRRRGLVDLDVRAQVRDGAKLVGLEELGAAVALLAGRHGHGAAEHRTSGMGDQKSNTARSSAANKDLS